VIQNNRYSVNRFSSLDPLQSTYLAYLGLGLGAAGLGAGLAPGLGAPGFIVMAHTSFL